ncbi:MAG: hypothetical protein ACQCN3_02640 [Candidatus Bathyarchaeia archaeon]|jgi:hypothetical protein
MPKMQSTHKPKQNKAKEKLTAHKIALDDSDFIAHIDAEVYEQAIDLSKRAVLRDYIV